MRRFPAIAITALLLGIPGSGRAAAPKPEHDLTYYPILVQTPEMSKVNVRADIPFKSLADGRSLTMDVYSPPGSAPGTKLPVIVFVNGVGDMPGPDGSRLKTWGQYTSWARLAAVSGYVAVTHDSRGPEPAEDIRDLFRHLRESGAALGIDATRMGAWACSANVRAALAFAMGDGAAGVQAAVFYYGFGDVETLRPDLPVLLVRAGKDSAFMNDGIGRLVPKVTAQNAPWTILNLPEAHHAFDIFDNTVGTRDAIMATLRFFDGHLRPEGYVAASLPLAREALGYWFQQDWPRAAEAYQKLLAGDPNDATVLARLGSAEVNTRRIREGLAHLDRAVSLGESSPQIFHQLGYAYVTTQSWEKGLEFLQRAIDLNWANGQTWSLVALAHAGLKRYPEAIRDLQRAIEMGPVNPAMHYNLACMYALSGDRDHAIEALGRAIDSGFKDREGIVDDPDLASIRGDERYASLLHRLD